MLPLVRFGSGFHALGACFTLVACLSAACGKPSPAPPVPAPGPAPQPPPAHAEPSITIAFAPDKPPYIMPHADAKVDAYAPGPQLGIQVDLCKAALEGSGYRLKPAFLAFKRLRAELDAGTIDGAEISGRDHAGLFLSQTFVGYRNFVVTHKSANLKIERFADLKDLRVAAWQGASGDIGKEFGDAMRGNPGYAEYVNQEEQYLVFRSHRADAAVLDRYIYAWWDQKYARKEGAPVDAELHWIFPSTTDFYIAFRSEALRDAFDKGLQRIRADGTYERIVKGYIPDP